MINTMSRWLARAPARLVQCGLWMFFVGGAGLLFGMLAQLQPADDGVALAERFPDLPTWFVPETPGGYTVAATLVCWGVWAMGAGLRRARLLHRR